MTITGEKTGTACRALYGKREYRSEDPRASRIPWGTRGETADSSPLTAIVAAIPSTGGLGLACLRQAGLEMTKKLCAGSQSRAGDGDAQVFVGGGGFLGGGAFDDDAAGFGCWRDDVGGGSV